MSSSVDELREENSKLRELVDLQGDVIDELRENNRLLREQTVLLRQLADENEVDE